MKNFKGLIYNPMWIKYHDSKRQRLLDFLFALTGIILFSPVFIIASIAIIIEDGFPIFYGQERVGKYGKIFKIFKFRSMIKDAEKHSGPVLSECKEDPRITKTGKFLRATAMDELPQIFNILAGHMSITGPRAERPFFVEKFKKEIPMYDMRHQVRPGLTGMAQVYGRYNTDARHKLRFDLLSVRKQGLILYFDLIRKSVWNTLCGKWTNTGKKR